MSKMRLIKMAQNGVGALLLAVAMCLLPVGVMSATFSSAVLLDDTPKLAAGVVVDKATGEPILSANVAVWSGDKLLTGTSTDYEGKFRIISPTSDFELKISFIGYFADAIITFVPFLTASFIYSSLAFAPSSKGSKSSTL